MAGLKDFYDSAAVNIDVGNQLARLNEQAQANSMNALQKGWEAGRLGTDVNANNARMASLRADGQMQEADALAAQNAALAERQAMYAPRVGQVEDIRGLSDFGSWAATQIGQGSASMMDPMVAAAGATAAGNAPLARCARPAGKAGGRRWGAPAPRPPRAPEAPRIQPPRRARPGITAAPGGQGLAALSDRPRAVL